MSTRDCAARQKARLVEPARAQDSALRTRLGLEACLLTGHGQDVFAQLIRACGQRRATPFDRLRAGARELGCRVFGPRGRPSTLLAQIADAFAEGF